MADLEITTQTITGVTAMTKLSGDMDTGNFDLLEDEFNKLLDSGILGLVLEISGLDSLSSAGIGAILNMSRVLETRKGKLIVAAARPKIVGLIEMLDLRELVTMTDTADQARKIVSSIR